jgi:hypothetical protein
VASHSCVTRRGMASHSCVTRRKFRAKCVPRSFSEGGRRGMASHSCVTRRKFRAKCVPRSFSEGGLQSFLGKCLPRSSLQIPFKRSRPPPIRKADIRFNPPRTKLRSVRAYAIIVVGQSLPKIAGYSEIPLVRMIEASKNVDILHVYCSGLFSTCCAASVKSRVSLS